MFQFLIGISNMGSNININNNVNVFQFLIGISNIFLFYQIQKEEVKVSIPYRYL